MFAPGADCCAGAAAVGPLWRLGTVLGACREVVLPADGAGREAVVVGGGVAVDRFSTGAGLGAAQPATSAATTTDAASGNNRMDADWMAVRCATVSDETVDRDFIGCLNALGVSGR